MPVHITLCATFPGSVTGPSALHRRCITFQGHTGKPEFVWLPVNVDGGGHEVKIDHSQILRDSGTDPGDAFPFMNFVAHELGNFQRLDYVMFA